jgi:hypothetical protein
MDKGYSMKASHSQLVKLAELGILKSLQSFLTEPLKPGRLRTKLQDIDFFVTNQLNLMYAKDPNIFIQNKKEIAAYLEKFNNIMHGNKLGKKERYHITTIVHFCLSFLKETKTIYPKELTQNLESIIDYYSRTGFVDVDLMVNRNFNEEWSKLNA